MPAPALIDLRAIFIRLAGRLAEPLSGSGRHTSPARMPDLAMTRNEAEAIAAWLLRRRRPRQKQKTKEQKETKSNEGRNKKNRRQKAKKAKGEEKPKPSAAVKASGSF